MNSTTDPNPRPPHCADPSDHSEHDHAGRGQLAHGPKAPGHGEGGPADKDPARQRGNPSAAEGQNSLPSENAEFPIPASISMLVADQYGALRALAERQVTAERARTGQQTISPTSLLGETFRRLVQQETKIANPDHLAAIATMLFVRIIADRRRRRLTIKRGGGAKRRPIGEEVAQSDARSPAEQSAHMSDVDVLHDKLAELAQISPRRAEALSLHMIGGITIPNVAKLLNVSVATVERDLALARAWLAAQMR